MFLQPTQGRTSMTKGNTFLPSITLEKQNPTWVWAADETILVIMTVITRCCVCLLQARHAFQHCVLSLTLSTVTRCRYRRRNWGTWLDRRRQQDKMLRQEKIEMETWCVSFLTSCPNFQIGFPGGSNSKVSGCHAGDPGSIPGSGKSPGEGNGHPLQYMCLENSVDGGAW